MEGSMNHCPAAFLGIWMGHNFQPRYDEKKWGPQWLESGVESGRGVKHEWWGEPPTKDYAKTYVQDVCVRCGSVVKRQ